MTVDVGCVDAPVKNLIIPSDASLTTPEYFVLPPVTYLPTKPRSSASPVFVFPTNTRGSDTVRFSVSTVVPVPPNEIAPLIFTSPVIPTPPTTVSAPVVGDVEGVSISI